MRERTMDHRNQAHEIRNADYLVWRVQRGQKRHHDKQVRRIYNMRACHKLETRH